MIRKHNYVDINFSIHGEYNAHWIKSVIILDFPMYNLVPLT